MYYRSDCLLSVICSSSSWKLCLPCNYALIYSLVVIIYVSAGAFLVLYLEFHNSSKWIEPQAQERPWFAKPHQRTQSLQYLTKKLSTYVSPLQLWQYPWSRRGTLSSLLYTIHQMFVFGNPFCLSCCLIHISSSTEFFIVPFLMRYGITHSDELSTIWNDELAVQRRPYFSIVVFCKRKPTSWAP